MPRAARVASEPRCPSGRSRARGVTGTEGDRPGRGGREQGELSVEATPDLTPQGTRVCQTLRDLSHLR